MMIDTTGSIDTPSSGFRPEEYPENGKRVSKIYR